MTPDELYAWRKARSLSQAEAYAWYNGIKPAPRGSHQRKRHARVWRRWEKGERAIPRPLLARIHNARRR